MHYWGYGQRITASPSLIERYHKLQEEWKYIDDSTFSRSIDSYHWMTCSKFDYSN